MNSARHESTGFTPAFFNFGKELEVRKALYRERNGTPEEDVTEIHRKGQLDRLHELKEVFESVKVNLSRAFTTQSRYYNLRRRHWRCRVGDRVMKRENPLSSAAKGFSSILAPKYSGPYTVVKIISPIVNNLKSESGKISQRIHIKDLKPVT